MVDNQAPKLPDDLMVPTERKVTLNTPFHDGKPEFVQPGRGCT
jgi:hypothetical protein